MSSIFTLKIWMERGHISEFENISSPSEYFVNKLYFAMKTRPISMNKLEDFSIY